MAHEAGRRGFRGGAAEQAVDVASAKFDAHEFITTRLADMTGEELAAELQTQLTKQDACEEDMRNMVAEHLNTFVQCKDTVEALHASDKSLFTSATLKGFLGDFDTLRTACLDVFTPLLERERELSEVKKAQHVFDKVEFLFDIPDTIKKNIAQREYASVLYDYKRARAFEESMQAKDIPSAELFNGVFDEVNEAVGELRRELRAQLMHNLDLIGRAANASGSDSQPPRPCFDTDASSDLTTEKIISILSSLATPDLAASYISCVREAFTKQLLALSNALSLSIEREVNDAAGYCHDGGEERRGSRGGMRASSRGLRTFSKLRTISAVSRQLSESALDCISIKSVDEAASTLNLNAPPLQTMLPHVSETCGLAEASEYIAQCGMLLKAHLSDFLFVFHRQWGDQDASGTHKEPSSDVHVQELFHDCAAAFDAAVWPVVCRLQPSSTSGVSMQRWRGALMSAAKPVASLSEASAYGAAAFHSLRDRWNAQFHTQTSGKLTTEIESWGRPENISWDVHLQVSRHLPTTALPLKFETAVASQLEFLASSDDRLKSAEQEAAALRHMVRRAHEDFVDLLYHIAFEHEPSGTDVNPVGKDFVSPLAHYLGAPTVAEELTREERLLTVWADCKALLDVVLGNAYSALRGHLGADANLLPPSTDNFANSTGSILSAGGGVVSPPLGPVSARWQSNAVLATPFDMNQRSASTEWLASSHRIGATPRLSTSQVRATGFDEDQEAIRAYIRELMTRIVREVVGLRMAQVSEIVCVEGFLKTDVNWAFCPEPRGLRNYCHTLLLNFVELHEATVRRTAGHATREVLTTVFNQTMAVFLYAVKQLDFYQCSELASLNATLQLEVEVAFLAQCMGGYKHAVWQGFHAQITDYLLQHYVNSNDEAQRRKRIRNSKEIFDEMQRLKALVEALKVDPLAPA
eukprot:TRINITY_DN6387_c0_g1_i1.p1 TRINITY_DN6387_c0_g1~~TRINITY_DN6387_c0_g1_i1.p1  ORF type:complete len:925 (+),score=213.79 TRINITY_DN6387_c0_g1_i1:124-2898(+)